MSKKNSTGDFVIQSGKLLGDFEGLYRAVGNPWGQSDSDQILDSRRLLAVEWCKKLATSGLELSSEFSVLELGCGFGFLTRKLHDLGFSATGLDISETAVNKARALHPGVSYIKSGFADFQKISDLEPDVIIMAEITWYVLDDLGRFKSFIKEYASSRQRPTYLIHLLTTYPEGVQTYGTEYFTNLDGILNYFELSIMESASFETVKTGDPSSMGTFFVARI